ncbi:MAG TPA: hypothetical protein VK610_02185, partial [Rhodothermales bacterium]|nr:hypothetical protein [Rhodothermales bacterium]
SLRALLDGLIDYAGLYPPTALPLDDAAARYARYRSGPDAWMLGRFILPASRLDELTPHLGRFATGTPLRLSVIAPSGGELPEAVAAARAFEAAHRGLVVADRFEARLRPEVIADRARLDGVIAAFEAAAARDDGEADRAFLEVPIVGEGWRPGLEAAAAAVAEHNARTDRPATGIKLRLGGEEAAAFPSVPVVAEVIAALRDAGAPFKATAGLHHPVRHPAPEYGAVMHGFVNVFAAAVLAHARRLDPDALVRVLGEERIERFVFDDDGLAWNGYGANTREVVTARATFCTSYGSCSFDEPRDDLRAAGLL